MAEAKTLNTRIVLRNDTLANWNTSSKALLKGEAALALREDGKYEIRFGSQDSLSTWSQLSSVGQLAIPAKNVEFLKYQEYKLSSLETSAGEQSKFQLWGMRSDTAAWESIGNAITVPEVDFGPINTKVDAISSGLSASIESLSTELSNAIDARSTSLSTTVDTLVSTTKTALQSEIRSVSAETLVSAAATAQSKADQALADAKTYTNVVSAALSADYQGKYDDIIAKIKDGIHFIGKVFEIGVTEGAGWYQKDEDGQKFPAANGDLVIKAGVEYVYSQTDAEWVQLGDEGTWASKAYVDTAKAEAISATQNTVQTVSAYSELTAGKNTGDVGLVKEEIGRTGKYEISAYTWNATTTAWVPMDAYYSADKVIMPSNMVITEKFGKYDIPSSGSKELTCAGMTVKAFINDAFAQTLPPTNVKPTCSMTGGGNVGGTNYEVGTFATSLPGATFKYTADGYYDKYNDNHVAECSVMLSSVELKRTASKTEDFDGNIYHLTAINDTVSSDSATATVNVNGTVTLNAEDSTNISVQITDSDITLATYSGKAAYCKGTYVPKNNIGGDAPDAIIPAASWTNFSGSSVCKAGSRRRFWYVGTDMTTTIDNDYFRGLATASNSDFSATSKSKSLAIPAGTKRVVLAVKGDVTLTKVEDVEGMHLDVKGNFEKRTISIAGANGFSPKSYSVFVCENAAGLKATTYIFS